MSLLNFQHLHQQIKDKLFEIAYKVHCFGKSGDVDISRYAETYFLLIFNIVFEKKGWKFKKATKINQETFDLYDEASKVCIQITSNNRSSKKAGTIKSFEENQLSEGYEILIILFISDSKPKTLNKNKKFTYEDYSITDLVALIETTCCQKQLLEIREILTEKLDASKFSSVKQKPQNNGHVSEKEFLRRKRIEKELKKELVIPEYWKKIDKDVLMKQPWRKFKDSRFILRSISDETYPNGGEDADWCRTFMYDFYERGILIDKGACVHYYAAINDEGKWFILDYFERDKPLPKGYVKEQIEILAKLPYKNIIHWEDGDEYYNDHHLFCKYDGIENSPYDEVVYKRQNRLGYYWGELDINKKVER
jgi:hypothetical protein